MQYTSEEREQFEDMFRAHHRAVRAYVRRRESGAEVDDIVSETFLVAWRRLRDIPDDPLPWLIGVARHVAGTKRRSDSRRLRLYERARADVGISSSPSEPEADHESEHARAALQGLNVNDREAITLIAWEGLTPTQAAAALGIPPNRFRVRLHRATRRLRWAMENTAAETPDAHPRGLNPHHHTSQGALS